MKNKGSHHRSQIRLNGFVNHSYSNRELKIPLPCVNTMPIDLGNATPPLPRKKKIIDSLFVKKIAEKREACRKHMALRNSTTV